MIWCPSSHPSVTSAHCIETDEADFQLIEVTSAYHAPCYKGIKKRAKFLNEIFRGYDFTGDRIFHFLIDFLPRDAMLARY